MIYGEAFRTKSTMAISPSRGLNKPPAIAYTVPLGRLTMNLDDASFTIQRQMKKQ
jgi:hypothetical protein